MTKDFFKVPKQAKPVTLWVHPEGRVLGEIFVREQSLHHIGLEEPVELMNQTESFVVIHRDELSEFRFYNKSSIVRVEYEMLAEEVELARDSLQCECHMMDGSLITGTINGNFPPDRRRLFDYMNNEHFQFIPLHQGEGKICLINKHYINYTKSL
ncbi:MAG: hypothetical protein GXP13_01505 [Gammaproteobacteria bacterium]|nr:hypothetical protein [Gammaproteobacteria bacterium]